MGHDDCPKEKAFMFGYGKEDEGKCINPSSYQKLRGSFAEFGESGEMSVWLIWVMP